MNISLAIWAAIAVIGGLLFCTPAVAQNPPPAPRAQHVEIIKGPALEISHDDVAIVRWTTNNPGDDDDHYSVIHYGTDPNDLSQTAKNHIRLNQSHPDTVFRVRMGGLKPATTYYYKVTSMGYEWLQRRGGELCSSVHHACPVRWTPIVRQPEPLLKV